MPAPAATLPALLSPTLRFQASDPVDGDAGCAGRDLSPSPAEAGLSVPPFPTAGGDGEGRVLVIDRVEHTRRFTGELLARHRFQVQLAATAEAAFEQLGDRLPDLVLIDLSLPGIDGIELCRRLSSDSATRGIPVILITAAHDASLAARGLTAGAVDFVTRPFHDVELIARVATRLSQGGRPHLVAAETAPRSESLSVVAHDLKNPLTSIRLAGHSLRQGLESDDPRLEMANIILESCEEMLGLIESRLSRPRTREAIFVDSASHGINLREVLDEVLQRHRPAARENNIDLRLRLPRQAQPRVEADCDSLVRVVENLLANAIRSAPSGSEVTVRIERVRQPAGWRVLVQDHGRGCSPAECRQLLDAGPGTVDGLGLARDLVDKLHGRIGYKTTAGGGATFWVELPAHAA